jgi:hypothetical protein
MPPKRATAPRGEAAVRRAVEELVAATAAEPAPSGTSAAGTPRRRVFAALAALRRSLLVSSPAGAAEALGVDGLCATLLREAAAPPGPHATEAINCFVAISKVAGTEGGQRTAVRDALSVALRRDAACLFDAMGRTAAMQAAARARSAGGAAPARSTAAPASAGLSAATDAAAGGAATPGRQLFVLLTLAVHLLSDRSCEPDDGAGKAFARSGAAVSATLEALLHGCPGFEGGDARKPAACALALVCRDLTGVRHLRGALPRVVPALVQRLQRGAPGWTVEERSCLVHVLKVGGGGTCQAGGGAERGAA